MERLAAGELEVLEQLVRRHAPALRAFVRMLGADEHRAEDVVQETFLEVFRARGRYRRLGTFRSWAFGIARNLHRAQARRRREVEFPDGQPGSGEGSPSLHERTASPHPQPDAAAEERESAGRLLLALRSLSSESCEALSLKFIRGFSYVEIAKILSAPESTVKTWAAQGLAHLRERMKP